MQTCTCCGKTKPLDEFPIHSTFGSELTPKIRRKRRCCICEVDARLDKKRENRYLDSFKQRRRRHAVTTGQSVAALKALGWDEVQRSREMQAMYEHGFCSGCIEDDGTVHFFRDMTQGLAELTIDIIDPNALPVWPGNVQWLCMTCNRRKQRKSGLEHGLEKAMVRQWTTAEATCLEESAPSLPSSFLPKKKNPAASFTDVAMF